MESVYFSLKKVSIDSKKIITYEQSSLSKDRLRIELESIILNFIKKIRGKNPEIGLGELYDNGLILQLYKKLLGNIKNSNEIIKVLNTCYKKINNRNWKIG